jgi:geranylgeranyl diphosphate synthase, type I
MSLQEFIKEMRPAIENNLQCSLDIFMPENSPNLNAMVRYHMGWEGESSGLVAQGKRIRSVLFLLANCAAGGNWLEVLPIASSLEYLHNFSLIHDDIQDKSETRRGRATIWAKWGIAQAINTGDYMFTLAHCCVNQLKDTVGHSTILRVLELMDNACIQLTLGQHLDLWYENKANLSISQYWQMIEGKTAALLGCAAELGSLISDTSPECQKLYWKFGYKLGMAFQVVDDWLGIWGNEQLTGKSIESDLTSGKKTLPILYAIENSERFRQRWQNSPISREETPLIARWMEEDGAQRYTEEIAQQLTHEAIQALEKANPTHLGAKLALLELAEQLTYRKQ